MRPAVLVLRALGLGDLLTGLPALRGLRTAFPRHELVLAAPPDLAPLATTSSTAHIAGWGRTQLARARPAQSEVTSAVGQP